MSSDSKPRSSWQPPSLAELQALLPAFEFHALIGRGGMGAVFKATQLSLNRPVAIKMLPTKLMEDADANFAARFRQEALTMAKLTHPGIVTVFESGEAGGLLYIVMEFVDGTDVARMIAADGKLAPELATRLLTQVCDALHYAHERGVIHRDIKPANLLLTRDGTVKIADFGLAKHDDATLQGLTKTNVAIGTPDFLAPEAWTPNTTLDGRADVYALGVTFYQMLTAEVPRGFWEMPSARVGTDKRFDAIIERALQPKPEARYQSSAELRRDLERIQAEPRSAEHRSALREQPTSEPSDARRSTASPKMRRVAAALVALAVILMGVIAVLLWPRPPQQASSTALSGPRNWIVTTTNDFGRGSLREALILVENGETITFAANLAGATILLEGGGIIVKKSIHIDASALPGGITLDGGGGHRVFEFVHCTNVLTGLTITNGNNLGHGAGGGLFNYFGHVTLNRCTLVGNRAFRGQLPEYAGGGGIFTYGTLILNQCTLAGNTSEQGGAIGVSRGGVAYLNHCTVVSNTATSGYGGGGISVRPGSQLILSNSIVAGNAASVAPNIAGAFRQAGTNLTEGDPRLATLGNYGGPTPTMPPLSESPAIDRCTNALAFATSHAGIVPYRQAGIDRFTNAVAFATDQRGTGYVRVMNAYADIGAAEALVPSIPNSSFEADAFGVYPGAAYDNGNGILGWTLSSPKRIGLNPVVGNFPFADNGVIPDGARVAYIQGSQGAQSMVAIMTGLTPGAAYQVSFRANCRVTTPAPDPAWSLNGGARMPFTASPPVDSWQSHKHSYYANSGSFVASSNTATLEVLNLSKVDASVLLDAFVIAPLRTVDTNDQRSGSHRVGLTPGTDARKTQAGR